MTARVLETGAPASAAEMTTSSDESKFTTPAASLLAKIVTLAVHIACTKSIKLNLRPETVHLSANDLQFEYGQPLIPYLIKTHIFSGPRGGIAA